MRLLSAITSTLVLSPLTFVVIGETVTGNTSFAFRKGSKGRILAAPSGKKVKQGSGKKEGQTLGKIGKKGSIITTDHDAVSPGPIMPVTNENAASTIPQTASPSPLPTENDPMPSPPAPVVPETPASAVPATPAPVVPETPAPVVPATPAPVVPVTPASVVPATPAPVAPAPVVPAPVAPAPVVPAPVAPAPVAPAPTLVPHPVTATSPSISPTCRECDDIIRTSGGGGGNDQDGDIVRTFASRDIDGTATDKIEVLSQETPRVNVDGEASVAAYTANNADPSVWELVSTDQMKYDFSIASSAFIFYTNMTVILLTLVCSIKVWTG